MTRRLILGVLVIVMGLVWSGPVWGQEAEKTIYNDPDMAYHQTLRWIEETYIKEWTEFNMCGVALDILPLEIGKLKQLHVLTLDTTRLITLPPEIAQLSQLHSLSINTHGWCDETGYIRSDKMSYRRLVKLPFEIGMLTQLQELQLIGASLTDLPAEIMQLTRLKKLYLDHTLLTTLPAEIRFLAQLQELSLVGTSLTDLPAEITQLTQLKKLHLNDTPITTLPAGIRHLTQLESLWLANTQITTLPLELGHLSQLKYLDLTNTPLTFPPPDIIAQGTPAILAYLRDYEAMLMRQTVAGIAAGIGGIAGVMLLFRWRQRRGLQEKKKRA